MKCVQYILLVRTKCVLVWIQVWWWWWWWYYCSWRWCCPAAGSASLPIPLRSALSSKTTLYGSSSQYSVIKKTFKTLIYIFSHNESWSKRRKVLPLTVFVSCAYFPLVERSLLCSSNLRYLLLHYCGQSRKLIVSLDGKWKVFMKLGWLFIYDVHRWLCEGMFPLSDLGVRWHCAG